VLTQQFHDIIPGSSIAWVHADAEQVHGTVIEALEARRGALLGALVPTGDHVVNPTAVDRDEVIETTGGPLRVQVPANGIAPLVAIDADDRVMVTERSMANHHLAVRWDGDGHLISVIDVVRARELLPAGASGGVLELAPDHPVRYDAWDLESWTPGLGEAVSAAGGADVTVGVIDDGPLLGRVRVARRFGPSTAIVTYTLRAGSPRLDIGVELDWQHREHLLSMAFPLDVHTDTAACDIQFGHVRRPTHTSTSWDAAKFEVCAHRYVDMSEPGFGVAVLNDGRYGHGLFGGRVRVSLARGAQYPDPDADRGHHAVRLALFPHGPGLDEVVAEAERFNAPVRVVSGSASSAPEPVVALVGDGVEIDAIKLADDPDDPDLIVRLHESVGNRTRVTVRCDRRILAASRCNLLEEPESGLEVGDGICAFTVMPFEIVTLRLTRTRT
jgi:alpha-mannosidase